MKATIAVPATLALLYRSYSKKSLTPAGIVAAVLTAVAHAAHPWNLPFVLLGVFFLAGTRATHVRGEPLTGMRLGDILCLCSAATANGALAASPQVKEKVKAQLTVPADGPSANGDSEPRTHVQGKGWLLGAAGSEIRADQWQCLPTRSWPPSCR